MTADGAMSAIMKSVFEILRCPLGVWLLMLGNALGQVVVAPTVEPGLDQAVKWTWQVTAGDAATWGWSIPGLEDDAGAPVETVLPAVAVTKPAPVKIGPPEKELEHVISSGQTLTIIASKYGLMVDHLKRFNALKTDVIRVGAKLRIPGVEDIKAMMMKPEVPTAEATPKPEEAPKPKVVTASTAGAGLPPFLIAFKPVRRPPEAAWEAARLVQIQAFLDRRGYSVGVIDGMDGQSYAAAFQAYQADYPGGLFMSDGTPSAAMVEMGGAYTEYAMRAADWKWISPTASAAPVSKKSKTTPPPVVTLDELTRESFLAYRSAWEFAAERFHCSETLLRKMNSAIKTPVAGTILLVPNVEPFEIEKALKEPLQPPADESVTAKVMGLKRLIIRKGAVVVANMPISAARPGLTGRGTWKVLDAVPRPKLVSTGDAAAQSPTPLTLASGPNNPAGIVWLNLAKAADSKVLPYGLHGTSIPGTMNKQESLGGFRMTNWDVARAMKLLPVGTLLKWE